MVEATGEKMISVKLPWGKIIEVHRGQIRLRHSLRLNERDADDDGHEDLEADDGFVPDENVEPVTVPPSEKNPVQEQVPVEAPGSPKKKKLSRELQGLLKDRRLNDLPVGSQTRVRRQARFTQVHEDLGSGLPVGGSPTGEKLESCAIVSARTVAALEILRLVGSLNLLPLCLLTQSQR